MRSGQAASDDLPIAALAVMMIVLAWTSVMLPGFGFPAGNNIYHVPIVLHYASSPEGPHDAFTRSLDHFVSGVWPALGLIANERNVAWVFFFAQLATRLVFVAGLYALLRCFSVRQLVAIALAGLASIAPVLKIDSPVGRSGTLSFFFDHTEVAIALEPLCWALLVRRRWTAAAAVIGVMFDANAFVGVWTVLAAAAALARSGSRGKRLMRQLAGCGLVFAITALPVMIWIFQTVSRPRPEFDFADYLRLYYPFHTFVDVQWDRGARYLAYLAAAGAAVRIAWRDMPGIEARTLVALLAAFLGLFLLAVPLPYVTHAPLLLNLYPLRADSVVNLLIAAFLLAWAGRWMSHSEDQRDTLTLAIAVSFLAGDMIAALLLLTLRGERTGPEHRSVRFALGAATGLLVASGSLPTLGGGVVALKLVFCLIALCAAFADRARDRSLIGPVTAALACAILPELPAYPWPLVGLAAVVAMTIAGHRWAGIAGFAQLFATIVWAVHTGDRLAIFGIALLAATGIAFYLPGLKRIRSVAASAVTPLAILAGLTAMGLARGAFAIARSSLDDPRQNSEARSTAQLWAR